MNFVGSWKTWVLGPTEEQPGWRNGRNDVWRDHQSYGWVARTWNWVRSSSSTKRSTQRYQQQAETTRNQRGYNGKYLTT